MIKMRQFDRPQDAWDQRGRPGVETIQAYYLRLRQPEMAVRFSMYEGDRDEANRIALGAMQTACNQDNYVHAGYIALEAVKPGLAKIFFQEALKDPKSVERATLALEHLAGEQAGRTQLEQASTLWTRPNSPCYAN